MVKPFSIHRLGRLWTLCTLVGILGFVVCTGKSGRQQIASKNTKTAYQSPPIIEFAGNMLNCERCWLQITGNEAMQGGAVVVGFSMVKNTQWIMFSEGETDGSPWDAKGTIKFLSGTSIVLTRDEIHPNDRNWFWKYHPKKSKCDLYYDGKTIFYPYKMRCTDKKIYAYTGKSYPPGTEGVMDGVVVIKLLGDEVSRPSTNLIFRRGPSIESERIIWDPKISSGYDKRFLTPDDRLRLIARTKKKFKYQKHLAHWYYVETKIDPYFDRIGWVFGAFLQPGNY